MTKEIREKINGTHIASTAVFSGGTRGIVNLFRFLRCQVKNLKKSTERRQTQIEEKIGRKKAQ